MSAKKKIATALERIATSFEDYNHNIKQNNLIIRKMIARLSPHMINLFMQKFVGQQMPPEMAQDVEGLRHDVEQEIIHMSPSEYKCEDEEEQTSSSEDESGARLTPGLYERLTKG